MASGVGPHPTAGGAEAAPAPAPRPAPLAPPAGDLDPTFGNGGKVTTDFGSGCANDFATAMAIQSNGKIVAAGQTRINNRYHFALARYNGDGTLDTSFGSGGLVTTDLGGEYDAINAVVIQSEGKIVVAGNGFTLARYNSDGTLDASFGSSGVVTTDYGGWEDNAYDVIIQSNGKIVAAGSVRTDRGYDFALARYNGDGSLDKSFGSGGLVTTDFGSAYDGASAVTLQRDGKIVAAGEGREDSSYIDFALARYNSDGTLDASFGSDGKVTTDLGEDWAGSVGDVAIQRDGKIVAAGGRHTGGQYDFALARYNDDGSLDTSFGNSGLVTTDFGNIDLGSTVAIQSDGKIVIAGGADISGDYDYHFALARYNGNGTLDATFAGGGKVTTDFGGWGAVAGAVAIQRDGKIVAAGYTGIYEIYDFALARYQASSTGSQTIADGASATLEGVAITNHSGVPCNLTVTRHPIPPGGAPADLGELPVLWQLTTTCPSYNFDLVFSYTDTELLIGNNVSEARFQAYCAPDMNGPFSPVDSVVDTDANIVTVTGVTQLCWWGLIGRGPQLYLPLVLHQ
jgi:uncharacterized delta-60 repeat protein